MSDNLQKLIKLAQADGGKFFVLDEKGEPSLVIMSIDQYEEVLLKKVQNQLEDIEEINRKIIDAQKNELETQRRQSVQEGLVSEVIDSTFSFEPEVSVLQQRAELEDI